MNKKIKKLISKKEKIVKDFWDLTRYWNYEEAEGEKLEMDKKIESIDMDIYLEEESEKRKNK